MASTSQEAWYMDHLERLFTAAQASGKTFEDYGKIASSPGLKAMMEAGAKDDTGQLDALKTLLGKAGGQPGSKANPLIEAIIADGKKGVDAATNSAIRDAAIVHTLQVTLHY